MKFLPTVSWHWFLLLFGFFFSAVLLFFLVFDLELFFKHPRNCALTTPPYDPSVLLCCEQVELANHQKDTHAGIAFEKKRFEEIM